MARGSSSRCSPRPLYAQLSSIFVGRDAAPENERDPWLEQPRVPSPRLRWWPMTSRLQARSIKSEEITAHLKPTLVVQPCKDCLCIRCRAKDLARCTVPGYERSTGQAGAGSPTLAEGCRVLAGIIRRQMPRSPHLYGSGRAGRNQHFPRQPRANCESPEPERWAASGRGRKGAMSWV